MAVNRLEIIKEDLRKVAANGTSSLERLKGETILVTGGTGFMGTWISELVTFLNDEHGFEIKLILLSSHVDKFKRDQARIAERDEVTVIQRDVRNLKEIPTNVSYIIHAAANPDRRSHASEPLRTVEVIVDGTKAVLDYASRLPDVKKILNISSGLVYGPQPWDVPGISESMYGPLDCSDFNSAYPESKRVAETICAIYRNQHRLPIVNARPFAFIGPYQSLDRPWAVNNFIRDGLLGGPIRIQGDGLTVRSYMYPSDMAWWLLNFLARGEVGRSYNMGSPEPTTLLNLAEMIASNLPNTPKIISGLSKDKSLHSSRFVPNVELASGSLGLGITVDLRTAINRTILWNQL